ncbi:MAG: AbrB/MazE/SpoVT family DNA-binding domain-containing protein [Clostridia bacterium]|nr:AbrB/MazE/SpoVT family DNA-binding domain-containing protein [Clostridia bacterium]
MKTTGIVRKIDEVGRIVLPKELRDILDIDFKTSMEIYIEGNKIILKKMENKCIFCGNTENIIFFKNKPICASCKTDLQTADS